MASELSENERDPRADADGVRVWAGWCANVAGGKSGVIKLLPCLVACFLAKGVETFPMKTNLHCDVLSAAGTQPTRVKICNVAKNRVSTSNPH